MLGPGWQGRFSGVGTGDMPQAGLSAAVASVAAGLQHDGVVTSQDNALHQWVRVLTGEVADDHPLLRAGGGSAPAAPGAVSVGARAARSERRHLMVLDFAKELPEDDEIVFEDIPGLSGGGEVVQDQFALVEAEVRRQLATATPQVVEAIVDHLRGFEHDVFETRDMPRPPPMRELDLEIPLKPGAVPPISRPYKVAPQHLPELNRQIRVLLDAGIIRKSVSQYGAPVLFAPKKDGKLRLCVDYRALNLQTVRDRFPTPTASDLIARTRGARMFSKIDLQAGFHQLNIKPSDREKTSFVTPDGQYEWISAPFGLSATPSAFQRLMSTVLHDHIVGGYCVVFCDDIAIFTESMDPMVHLAKIEAVLQSLRDHQLLAKGAKTELFRTKMEFLGFVISAQGVAPLKSKVEAVLQVPAPETVSQLRSFLGMTNFFSAHLPAYSERAAPLTDLLKGTINGRQRVAWTVACEESFGDLKRALTTAPVLRHFDPGLRTAVHIDGSANAVGAVLLQWEVGEQHPRPVCFLSRKLQGPQYRYDARNVEALAAQIALAEWRTLLYGVPFEIFSDHGSLQYLFTQKAPSQRILRMCEFLSDFNFSEVQFVRGVDNVVPDFLSRPYEASVADKGIHSLSHPRAPRISGLAAAVGQGRRVVVLPEAGRQLALRVSGEDSQGQSIYDLFTARVQGRMTAQETAQALMASVFADAAMGVTCVGSRDGVSFWRAATLAGRAAPFQAQWAGVSEWVDVDANRRLGFKVSWRRFAFECLGPLGVLGRGGLLLGTLPMSVSALCSGAAVTSSSLVQDIKKELGRDPFLSPIVDKVKESDEGHWRDFRLDPQGLLCYQHPDDEAPRVCVPAPCRGQVLRAAHGGSTFVGHPGVHRTTTAVRRFFFWPTLARDAAHFVRSCVTCAGAKSSTHLRLGTESFSSIPPLPFSSWAMDLVGPMPPSRAGNDMFVTWVDRTSKLIVAKAFKQKDESGAADLAKMTFEAICCRFGLPVSITHDNDRRFVSSLWKHLWQLVGTKLKFTSSYNPQSDPAERANRQVLEALRGAVSSVVHYDEWDTALPEICFSLNNQVSSSTGTSPFQLAHGFPARTPLSVGLNLDAAGLDKAAVTMGARVQARFQAAADQAAAAQARLGHVLEKRRSPADVAVGDRVWLDGAHVPHQLPFKLANRWFGPYVVLQVMGGAVRLDLPESLGKTSDIINFRRLKFFEERDADLGADDPPVTPLIDPLGVPRFEISRLLGYRVWRHRPEYWVEWKGYDTSHNTWVHRDSLLQDVPALVAAYDRNPTTFQARASAPKRATKGRQLLASPPGSPQGRQRLVPPRGVLRGRGVPGLRASARLRAVDRA